MSHFCVRVIYENGKLAKDIAVMIDYGLFGGTEKKELILMVGWSFIIKKTNQVIYG